MLVSIDPPGLFAKPAQWQSFVADMERRLAEGHEDAKPWLEWGRKHLGTYDFDPDQPRDPQGKWTGAGGDTPAYHGSPYAFSEFASKVGSGEGTDAFGYGLYFSENRAVAEHYRRALSGQRGQPVGGVLYEVNLDVERSKLLDWDKPLSQQPKISKILGDQIGTAASPFTGETNKEIAGLLQKDATGEAVMELVGGSPQGVLHKLKEGSESLHKIGIQGVKYLDKRSRAKGEGTSNYVVFDPKRVHIVHAHQFVDAAKKGIRVFFMGLGHPHQQPAPKADVEDFDPDQPRDPEGRWTFAGGGPAGEHWQDIANTAVEDWRKEHPRVAAKTTQLRQDIDQAMREAEKFMSYRDWYEQHRPLARELFGKHEPLFEKFLAAASINSGGATNVTKAISAMSHYLLGGKFDSAEDYGGVVPVEREQYRHIERNEPLSGEKIVPFHKALTGDWDQAPADRHMKNLLFSNPTLSGGNFAQPEVTKAVVGAMARKMGWKAAELQAVLWVVQKAREEKGLAGTIFTYKQYLEEEESRIRAIMHTVTAFSKDALDAMSPQLQLLAQAANAYRNARLLLTFIGQFHLHPHLLNNAQRTQDYDPDQPRVPKGSGEGSGEWTAGGGGGGFEFVSPNIEHTGFEGALRGLTGDRQRALRLAATEIDGALGLDSVHTNIVGAWSDGAENSILSELENPDWDKLKLSGAMKGYLADQKSVLLFKQDDKGKAVLYKWAMPGTLESAHRELMQAGITDHTLQKQTSGVTAYVVDRDGKLHDKIAHASSGADVEYQFGRAEFIGTTKDDGTDRQQRDDARRAYAEIIKQSPIQNGTEVWDRVHNRWGEALNPKSGKIIQIGRNQPFEVMINPSERDLRSMVRESSDQEIRVLLDKDNNLFAWDARHAIHASVEDELRLKAKEWDNWILHRGKLVSGRYFRPNPNISEDVQRRHLRQGETEVRSWLKQVPAIAAFKTALRDASALMI